MKPSPRFHEYLSQKRQLIDQTLEECLPNAITHPSVLHEAMRYSVFAGGKRLRPIMLLMTAEMLGQDCQAVAFAGAALESVHTYSLIHDDLPAMDDDDLRRGRPTNHKVYGEATAILAGDALLTMAFQIMTDSQYTASFEPHTILTATRELASAAGSSGMVGGQVLDMQSEGKHITKRQLEEIHKNKTGKMLLAAVRIGAILSKATAQQLEAVSAYGKHVGLAFQIVDDILDLEGNAEELGKSPESDLQHDKATYPALYGLKQSKIMVQDLTARAKHSLHIFGDRADSFVQLADFMGSRTS